MSKLSQPKSFRKSTIREYFESIVIAVILALFIRTWVVQAFKIPTGSMENNLLVGDHLLVNKFVFGPTLGDVDELFLPHATVERGDVIVFKFPNDPQRDFIKRVIGLPGEQIEIRNKTVYIDEIALEEPYLPTHMTSVIPGGVVIDRRDNLRLATALSLGIGSSIGVLGALLYGFDNPAIPAMPTPAGADGAQPDEAEPAGEPTLDLLGQISPNGFGLQMTGQF